MTLVCLVSGWGEPFLSFFLLCGVEPWNPQAQLAGVLESCGSLLVAPGSFLLCAPVPLTHALVSSGRSPNLGAAYLLRCPGNKDRGGESPGWYCPTYKGGPDST